MTTKFGFLARLSGRKPNSYYIDCQGEYKLAALAKNTGLKIMDLKLIYAENGGVHDEEQDVYYFDSLESATNSISQIINKIPVENKGRSICFTEGEIEYIRRALINENSSAFHLSSKIKDQIFKKLNG